MIGPLIAWPTTVSEMKLFGISNYGLALIATLVAMLWGVLLMERSLNLQTQRDYEELIRTWSTTPVVSQPEQETAKPLPNYRRYVG
jgi:hypothetical protein